MLCELYKTRWFLPHVLISVFIVLLVKYPCTRTGTISVFMYLSYIPARNSDNYFQAIICNTSQITDELNRFSSHAMQEGQAENYTRQKKKLKLKVLLLRLAILILHLSFSFLLILCNHVTEIFSLTTQLLFLPSFLILVMQNIFHGFQLFRQ